MRKPVSFVDVQPPGKSLSGATDGMQQTHTIQSFILIKGVSKHAPFHVLDTMAMVWCLPRTQCQWLGCQCFGSCRYKPRSLISFLCLSKCQPMAKKRCLSAVMACRADRATWWVGACVPSWRSVAFHICHAGRSRQNGTCQTDVTHPVLLFSSTR